MTWTEQEIPGDIRAVAADGDGFVAVGRADEAPAAWVSMDGISWERVAVPPPAEGLVEPDSGLPPDYAVRGSAMGRLVRLDETLYSFGFFNFMDFVRPVGWRWTDGEAWEAIGLSSAFYQEGFVWDATAGNGVLVAARSNIALGLGGADSTVWSWTPESSWVPSDLSVSDPDRVAITDVAWRDGVFMAAGAVEPEEQQTGTPGVWESADGLAWTELTPPDAQNPLCALEPGRDLGLVALTAGAETSSVWTWRAGTWDGVALPGASGSPGRQGGLFWLCEVITLADRTVAIIGTDAGTEAWVSVDGRTWTGPEVLEGLQFAAGLGSTLVLISWGNAEDPSPITSTVRTGTAP